VPSRLLIGEAATVKDEAVARRILVTGGTGTLGAVVVERLVQRAALDDGDEVLLASRRPRPAQPTPYTWMTVDYTSGDGLEAAVDGVDVIIHCANDRRDVDADRALIHVARRAGGVHFVNISIVGIERIRLGYYGRKFAVEKMIESSGLPWTNLRTTQFHDLVATVCRQLARPPLAFAPTLRVQPIDVREVADRLVELAESPAAGRVTDMGGPAVRGFDDLMRAYLAARGQRRPIVPLPVVGKAFRDLRKGHGLAEGNAVGRITFEEHLADKLRPL
jgi:uncharacterized protein YbjT (DUF2867 family)